MTVTSRPQLQAILGKMERQARDDWGRSPSAVAPGRCAPALPTSARTPHPTGCLPIASTRLCPVVQLCAPAALCRSHVTLLLEDTG